MAAVPTLATNEDLKIAQNRGKMGVLLLRKKEGSQGLSSGSIVNVVKSKHFLKSKVNLRWCILTSNVFPPGDIRMDDYFIECANSETHELSDIAQSADCYRPPGGLVLIPVHPTTSSKVLSSLSMNSSVFDDRRTFSTEYYYEGEGSECCSDKICFIVGSFESKKDSWTVERFTLITKKDDQGQLQYELHAVDGTVFQTYDDIMARSHLYPRGAVILKGEEATCIGVLNFSDDEIKKMSPVFFTPESLTGEVQLYFPTRNNNEGRTEVDASLDDSVKSSQEEASSEASSSSDPVVRGYRNQRQMLSAQSTLSQNLATECDNPDEGSSNDGLTVYPDDNTLQEWQKLCTEKTDECAALKQQSERDQQTISLLKEHNSELRINIKKTEQQNRELCTEMEKLGDLPERNEVLRTENEDLRRDNKELHVENERLRKERLTEGKTLREDNRQLRAVNKKLRDGWSTERTLLCEENDALRAENDALRAENDALRAENEEWPNKLGKLLCQKDSAVEDTSSSDGSKDIKAEGSAEPSANNKQGDSDGSCKEKPFLDPVSEDVSKLD